MAEGKRRAMAGAMPAVDDYQTREDVRTLMEAHKIKRDKPRHKRAKDHAKAQLSAMQKVADDKEDRADGGRDEAREKT